MITAKLPNNYHPLLKIHATRLFFTVSWKDKAVCWRGKSYTLQESQMEEFIR